MSSLCLFLIINSFVSCILRCLFVEGENEQEIIGRLMFVFLIFSAFENSLYLLSFLPFFFFFFPFLTSFQQRYSKKTLCVSLKACDLSHWQLFS